MKEKRIQGSDSFDIVYKLGKKDNFNAYEAARFSDLTTGLLVPFRYVEKKGRYQLCYSISAAWQSLSDYLGSIDSVAMFVDVCEAFCRYFDNARAQGVVMGNLLFDDQHVFVDAHAGFPELRFIALPVEEAGGGIDALYALLRGLPSLTPCLNDGSQNLFAQSYGEFFVIPETFSLVKYHIHLGQLRLEYLHEDFVDSDGVMQNPPSKPQLANLRRAKGEENRNPIILTRCTTGESCDLQMFSRQVVQVALGSGPSADVRCEGNPLISRMHARLSFVKGRWFVSDEESKNGTYVGDRRLVVGEQAYVAPHSSFYLANEEFVLDY